MSPAARPRYLFSDFVLSPARRLLLRSRREVPLIPRYFGRVWQAAGTVNSVLKAGLLEKAVAAGLRSLFVGFETLNPAGLRAQGKVQNLHRDYDEAVRRLHGLGVMEIGRAHV